MVRENVSQRKPYLCLKVEKSKNGKKRGRIMEKIIELAKEEIRIYIMVFMIIVVNQWGWLNMRAKYVYRMMSGEF